MRIGARLSVLGIILGTSLSCGGGGPAGSFGPRYHGTQGSALRYHIVHRRLPNDGRGRTISAQATSMVVGNPIVDRDDDGTLELEMRYGPVHVAGTGGNPVQANGTATAHFRRDAFRRVSSEPVLEGDVGPVRDLLGLLTETLTLPTQTVGLQETWPLPPIRRTIDGVELSVDRTATLIAVEDGVATIEVAGRDEQSASSVNGVDVQSTATVTERYRIRVADGVLVEGRSLVQVELRSPHGAATHRERSDVQRIFGTWPSPAAHDWVPEARSSACQARLDAMRRRFEHAPQHADLDSLIGLNIPPIPRSDRQPIDEAGPVVVGFNEAGLRSSLERADLNRAYLVYVLAVPELTDVQLRQIVEDVHPAVRVRRLARGQVIPPSPPRPDDVNAIAQQVAGGEMSVWSDAVRPLLALCRPAREAFAAMHAAAANERGTQVRASLLEALDRCGCETTDLPRLEHLLDIRFGGPELGWVELDEAAPVYVD